MELQEIVERYAQAIEDVDASVTTAKFNARTGAQYQLGFKSMDEEPAVEAMDEAWEKRYPSERQVHQLSVPYPGVKAAKVDHVLSTDGAQVGVQDEWGIEVKRLQFVGDNGKSNGYTTTKVLSPYLTDRGMLHDALRLREYGFTRRIAIVGYSFEYDAKSWLEASLKHTDAASSAVLAEVAKTMNVNGGRLSIRPLVDFADAILRMRGMTTGPSAEAPFSAPRHPAGGHGIVFGWEIRRPQLEPDYDPRHPW